MIVTPLYEYSSPGFVTAQFPPVSAAKSTITEPCFIAETIYALRVRCSTILTTNRLYRFSNELRGRSARYQGL